MFGRTIRLDDWADKREVHKNCKKIIHGLNSNNAWGM